MKKNLQNLLPKESWIHNIDLNKYRIYLNREWNGDEIANEFNFNYQQ